MISHKINEIFQSIATKNQQKEYVIPYTTMFQIINYDEMWLAVVLLGLGGWGVEGVERLYEDPLSESWRAVNPRDLGYHQDKNRIGIGNSSRKIVTAKIGTQYNLANWGLQSWLLSHWFTTVWVPSYTGLNLKEAACNAIGRSFHPRKALRWRRFSSSIQKRKIIDYVQKHNKPQSLHIIQNLNNLERINALVDLRVRAV